MSSTYHFYRPSEGHGLSHNPFNSIVAPRPIGWISTQSPEGVLNLAPYSFFNAFNYVPPIIGFSSVGTKDSLRNARANGYFCWSMATRPLAQAMNQTSAMVDPDIDEFQLAGLTPRASSVIATPHVAESPVSFECKVTQIVQLQTQTADPLDSHVVFGEVIGVHIDKSLIPNGIFDTVAAQPILRGGGPADYFAIDAGSKFEMHRPEDQGV